MTQEHFHFIVYYVAIIFLAAYAGLIYLYKGGRRALAGFLALALVSMEAAINTTVTSVTTTSRESYTRITKRSWILKDSRTGIGFLPGGEKDEKDEKRWRMDELPVGIPVLLNGKCGSIEGL